MNRRIGYVGGKQGAELGELGNPSAYHLKLILDKGNSTVSAFPFISK